MIDQDELTDDPFFRLSADSDWNACIGKQGTEENYLDGYIEAAMELVGTVIDKKMVEKRDTVVLAVLYNARHAIELHLKFTINRLAAIAVVPHVARHNHDIQSHLHVLEQADVGDETLRKYVRALKPFVLSLSRIDDDGQELRYHTNSADQRSLSGYSLVNLEIVRDSLGDLKKVLSELKYRTLEFVDEKSTYACTKELSRNDLISIAKSLPQLDKWKGPIFEQKKQSTLARYNLTSDQFSEAMNVIRSNREMKALVGEETTLMYLPDHMVVSVVQQWIKLHPQRSGNMPATIEAVDQGVIEAIMERSGTLAEVVSALQTYLTDQQLAELQVIYYLGRDRWFPEFYEDQVQRTRVQHSLVQNTTQQITHLMQKPNFLQALVQALPRIGRPSLAARLAKM